MEESKIQRFFAREPALTDLYNNRPVNSAVVLIRHRTTRDLPDLEIQQFYVQIGAKRLSARTLYCCLSVKMKSVNWELFPMKEILIKELVEQFGYRVRDGVFLEADRVYNFPVRPKKLRGFRFNKYKAYKAKVMKILKPCYYLGLVIEEVTDDEGL